MKKLLLVPLFLISFNANAETKNPCIEKAFDAIKKDRACSIFEMQIKSIPLANCSDENTKEGIRVILGSAQRFNCITDSKDNKNHEKNLQESNDKK